MKESLFFTTLKLILSAGLYRLVRPAKQKQEKKYVEVLHDVVCSLSYDGTKSYNPAFSIQIKNDIVCVLPTGSLEKGYIVRCQHKFLHYRFLFNFDNREVIQWQEPLSIIQLVWFFLKFSLPKELSTISFQYIFGGNDK